MESKGPRFFFVPSSGIFRILKMYLLVKLISIYEIHRFNQSRSIFQPGYVSWSQKVHELSGWWLLLGGVDPRYIQYICWWRFRRERVPKIYRQIIATMARGVLSLDVTAAAANSSDLTGSNPENLKLLLWTNHLPQIIGTIPKFTDHLATTSFDVLFPFVFQPGWWWGMIETEK